MGFLKRLLGHRAEAAQSRLAPEDFSERYRPGAAVIDVRTAGECAGGRLAGAVNVDVTSRDFAERVEALGLDREQPVYLYCRSGNRSERAAKILRQRGYAGAVNVGGYGALARAGLPTER